MKRLKLKHHPQLILLWVARNYLNEIEFKKLLNSLPMRNSDSIFLRNYLTNFDIERIRQKPVVWQDIWIYNYILYECQGKLPKTQLIFNYEQEIAIPAEEALKEFKKIFPSTL